VNPSNSRLVLDLARAGAFREIGIPELVLEESSAVLERLYGKRTVPSARSFLLRIGTLIRRDENIERQMENDRGLVPEKDLEILAAVRVFSADRLVGYDRHFNHLEEYRTPKRMIEEFSVQPYPSTY